MVLRKNCHYNRPFKVSHILDICEGLFGFKIDDLEIFYNIIFLVDLFTTQRGTIFYGSYMKGLPFLSKMVHKGKGLDPKTEPPGINFVE